MACAAWADTNNAAPNISFLCSKWVIFELLFQVIIGMWSVANECKKTPAHRRRFDSITT